MMISLFYNCHTKHPKTISHGYPPPKSFDSNRTYPEQKKTTRRLLVPLFRAIGPTSLDDEPKYGNLAVHVHVVFFMIGALSKNVPKQSAKGTLPQSHRIK